MGPTILPIKLVLGLFRLKGKRLDMKLTTYLHLESRLIFSASMPLLPYISADLGQKYLYRLYLYQHQTPIELQGSCHYASRRDSCSWSHVVRRSSRTISINSRSGVEFGDLAYTFTDTSECCTNFPTSKWRHNDSVRKVYHCLTFHRMCLEAHEERYNDKTRSYRIASSWWPS